MKHASKARARKKRASGARTRARERYQQLRTVDVPVMPFTPVFVSVRFPQLGSAKPPFWVAVSVKPVAMPPAAGVTVMR
jgi:hypothetical protein